MWKSLQFNVSKIPISILFKGQGFQLSVAPQCRVIQSILRWRHIQVKQFLFSSQSALSSSHLPRTFGRVSTAREDFFGLLRSSLLNFVSRGLHLNCSRVPGFSMGRNILSSLATIFPAPFPWLNLPTALLVVKNPTGQYMAFSVSRR